MRIQAKNVQTITVSHVETQTRPRQYVQLDTVNNLFHFYKTHRVISVCSNIFRKPMKMTSFDWYKKSNKYLNKFIQTLIV